MSPLSVANKQLKETKPIRPTMFGYKTKIILDPPTSWSMPLPWTQNQNHQILDYLNQHWYTRDPHGLDPICPPNQELCHHFKPTVFSKTNHFYLLKLCENTPKQLPIFNTIIMYIKIMVKWLNSTFPNNLNFWEKW